MNRPPPRNTAEALAELQEFELKVLGGARMGLEEFRRCLGPAAFHVWQVLLSCRNKATGETHASIAYLARAKGHAPLSERRVRRALEKLRRAKLVPTLRVRPLHEDENDPRQVTGKVVYRRVCGKLDGRDMVQLPSAAWAALKTLPIHGGRRRGAGRPARAPKNENNQRIQVDGNQVAPQPNTLQTRGPVAQGIQEFSSVGITTDLISSKESSRSLAKESSRSHDLSISKEPLRDGFASQTQGPAAPAVIFSEEEKAARRKDLLDLGWCIEINGDPNEPDYIPPRASMWVPPEAGKHGMPPYPGSTLLPSLKPPSPPLLNPKHSPDRHAHELLAAYKTVFEKCTGKRCWLFTVSSKSSKKAKALEWAAVDSSSDTVVEAPELDPSKASLSGFECADYYQAVKQAAATLLEWEVAPLVWAAWSFDTWFQYGMGKKAPPLKWVFNPKRLVEHGDWFMAEGQAYMIAPSILTPTAKKIQGDYAKMTSEMARFNVTTPIEIRAVVHAYFPGDTFNELLKQARAEYAAEEVRLKVDAARGEWLWPKGWAKRG